MKKKSKRRRSKVRKGVKRKKSMKKKSKKRRSKVRKGVKRKKK